MKGIIRTSLEQRVLVNLLFVLLLGVGFAVYSGLPVDSWPEVSLDQAWIHTYWDGAGAEDVERLVTRKIEEEIEDVTGVTRIISNSQPSVSFIDVKFDEDLDADALEIAFDDLRDALQRVVDLPEEAEQPVLRRLTTGEVYPIFTVVVSARDARIPEIVLRETTRDLRKTLNEVDGVEKVRYSGFRDRELKVSVDRLAARRHGLSLLEILAALGKTNRAHPGGSIDAPDVARDAPELDESSSTRERALLGEIRVKFDDEYSRPEDLELAVIRLVPGGDPIRLGDVARVEAGFERETQILRMNGNPAIVLNVAKALNGDTIRMRDACADAIARFLETAPAGIAIDIVADQSEIVRSRFGVLLENLLLGVVFVALILFFAFGLRNAIIALIGIPFAYVCCFLFFPSLDLTINNLTLFGMVLVGGMLVDDAIVVIENIYRHIEAGLPAHEAVFRGAREVAWPVLNACLTTVAAMLPLLIQGGVVGKFFSNIPKVVILALIFSVVQCVSVLPVHYLEFGSRLKKLHATGKRSAIERLRALVFQGGGSFYARCLAHVLRLRLAFLSLLLGVSVLLVGLVLQIPQDPWISDFNAIMVTIKCDPRYSLTETDRAARLVEEELESLLGDDIFKSYYSIVGFSMTTDGVFIVRPNVAFFMAGLEDRAELAENPSLVVNRLRDQLKARGAESDALGIVAFDVFAPHDGPPLGKPVAVRVESNDYARAKLVSELIQAELRTMEGVESIADNLDLGPSEFRFAPDAARASALGFFPQDIALALRAANDGLLVGSFKDRTLDEDVDIRVQYDPADRASPGDLLLADVGRAATGGAASVLVPIEEVANVDVSRPNASFYHYDTRRTVLVTADVDGVVATGPEINRRLQSRLRDVESRYPDVRLVYGGEFEENQKSMEEQKRSFLIALVLIYVLLAAQFRSYVQPLIVMAVVPFGVLGVLFGLWVRDQPFTIPTFIAMIGLAGVVVNDSLMLVEFINLRRREGLERTAAILTAARQRFRPVLLAAGTTICNLLPLAFGLGGGSRVWTPFAVSIVFGMAVASFMTLFMVPVLYSLVVRR